MGNTNIDLEIAKAQLSAIKEAFDSGDINLENYNLNSILLSAKIETLKKMSENYQKLDMRIPYNGC